MSSIAEFVIENSITMPNKAAIIFQDEPVTYKELASLIRSFAAALKQRKISKGSRILIEADNIIYYIAAFLGCELYGCIAVPIEKNISIYKLQNILTSTKPKLVFMRHNGERYEDFFTAEPLKHYGVPKPDAVISITCTTGTTGKPSLITHTNTSSIATAQNLAEATNITADTVMFTNTSFELSSGYRRIFATLYKGATIVASQNRLSLPEIEKYIIKYKVNHLSLVCSDITVLVNTCQDPALYSDIQAIESVAGEFPSSITTTFYRKFPNCILYNMYGTTESGCVLFNDTRKNHADNCLGRPTVNATIHLIDENGQDITEPGKYGYIAVSGDMNMNGYYKKKELTEQVMSNNRLVLKDIVYFDEEGYYYFVSRVGDILNIKGHKVPPSSIEIRAKEFSGVADCACIGKKDSAAGEVPVLYVQCEHAESFDTDALKEYLAAHLESYCVPQEIIIIDKIPRTYSGKLLRKSLNSVTTI